MLNGNTQVTLSLRGCKISRVHKDVNSNSFISFRFDSLFFFCNSLISSHRLLILTIRFRNLEKRFFEASYVPGTIGRDIGRTRTITLFVSEISKRRVYFCGLFSTSVVNRDTAIIVARARRDNAGRFRKTRAIAHTKLTRISPRRLYRVVARIVIAKIGRRKSHRLDRISLHRTAMFAMPRNYVVPLPTR